MAISTKISFWLKRQSPNFLSALFVLLFATSFFTCYAQQPIQRQYANTVEKSADEYLLALIKAGYVTDAQKAVDGNTQSAATLNSTVVNLLGAKVGGTSSIRLRFTGVNKPNAGTPVTIKLGTGSNLLSVLGGLTIQAVKGSGNSAGNGNEVGPLYTGASLLNLLGGEEQTEFTITPNGDYDGVKISLKSPSGLLSVGALASAKVYHAYFNKPANGVVCDQPIDILNGSTGNIAGGLNPVVDPENAIDGNENTAALLRANVSLLNRTYITAIFPSNSLSGDSIRLVVQPQGSGLLDATLLSSNFTVRTFQDNTANGTIALQPQLLGLKLLTGFSNKYVLSYPINTSFNRIEVSLGEGLLNALNGLFVYEIGKKAPNPIITAPGLSGNNLNVCEGQTVDLTITNPNAGAVYKWFDAPVGGTEITTDVSGGGTTFSPKGLIAGTYDFYVALYRNGCVNAASDRTKLTVTVKPASSATAIQATNTSICLGQTATLVAPTLATPGSVSNPVFTWYFDQNKTQPITNSTISGVTYSLNPDGSLTVQGLIASKSYYISVQGTALCENANGNLQEVSVNVDVPEVP